MATPGWRSGDPDLSRANILPALARPFSVKSADGASVSFNPGLALRPLPNGPHAVLDADLAVTVLVDPSRCRATGMLSARSPVVPRNVFHTGRDGQASPIMIFVS